MTGWIVAPVQGSQWAASDNVPSCDGLLHLEALLHRRPWGRNPMQDPLAEQIQLGTAIAQTLKALHPTDLAFILAGAPRCSQGGSNRVVILAQAAGRGAKWREVRVLDRFCRKFPKTGMLGLASP